MLSREWHEQIKKDRFAWQTLKKIEAIFANSKIDLRDPNTGNLLFSFTPSFKSTWMTGGCQPGEDKTMRLLSRPVLTRDDKLYFTTMAAPPTSSGYHGSLNPVYAEWCYSIKERKALDMRLYFMPTYRATMESWMRKIIKDAKDGKKYSVLYYISSIVKPDGLVSEDELTPLVFDGEILVGKGLDELDRIRRK